MDDSEGHRRLWNCYAVLIHRSAVRAELIVHDDGIKLCDVLEYFLCKDNINTNDFHEGPSF